MCGAGEDEAEEIQLWVFARSEPVSSTACHHG